MYDSFDHDYDLPKEKKNSPAVNSLMLLQKLGSHHQGYPQMITVEATTLEASVLGFSLHGTVEGGHSALS
jgi:hypothetical protein